VEIAPARALADGLSAAYLSRYSFLLADISKYDEAKEFRGHLALWSDEIKNCQQMALRARTAGFLLR